MTSRGGAAVSSRAGAALAVDAVAPVPTSHGEFRFHVFRSGGRPEEHVALVVGDPAGDDVLVRVHSECMTSEVFGSLKCDCAAQLDRALHELGVRGRGVLVYLRQEGRGIGLANKIRAYAMQSGGVDTVDANRLLGLPDDARTYDPAAAMLANLGVRSVALLTNNPAKLAGLRACGVVVRRRVPLVVATSTHGIGYLHAKRSRMGHLLPAHLLRDDAP